MNFIKTERQNSTALITIDRPETMNALSSALLSELKETFAALANEADIRAIVLTGAGKAFVAGADIGEMKDFSPKEALDYARRGAKVFSLVENMPQPVIAAINGYALGGGCELALACDMRIASERARFGQPEVGLGVTPGFGGTQRLTRTIGVGAAMQMILTGQPIDAAEALRIGLVNSVHPQDTMLDEATKLAGAIAANAPLAVRASKKAIREGADAQLDGQIAAEGKLFAQCFDTEDQKEAMAAFVEKRKVDGFKGK